MTDKSVYGGLFQDPLYLSTDPDPKKTDPYDKQDCIPSRYLGKGFVIGHACPGQHPDGYLEKKFLTLASAEPETSAPKRRAAAAKAAAPPPKPMSDREFRYASYPQESTGPGSYYGCFQNRPYPYMTEPWEDPAAKKKKRRGRRKPAAAPAEPLHLPNIKTNPPKKGTYGYPGLLLSNPPYNEQWRSEQEAQAKEERRQLQRRGPPPKPLGPAFRSPGALHAYLDELPSTGAPGVYMAYVAPEAKPRRRRGKPKPEPPVLQHDRPFTIPSTKKGDGGFLNPFPNQWIDPVELQTPKKKGRRRPPPPPLPQRPKGAGEWKPNSFEKTSVVSSCLHRFY